MKKVAASSPAKEISLNSAVIEGFVHPLLLMAKFMHRMGPVRGAVAFGRVTKNKRLSKTPFVYALNVRGYQNPISLRSGDSDGEIFGQVIIEQQYNLPVVKDTRVIVDCGANIGLSALFFAKRYPDATILAIEPEPNTYAMLVRNTQHLPNIRPIHGAIWPRPASLSIVDPTRSSASKRVGESQGQGTGGIRSVLLRDVVAEYGKIDILKVDIEGSEKALFGDPASEEWLTHTRVIYAELHDWMQLGSSRAFYQAVTKFDFSQQYLGEIVSIELHHPEH